MFIKILALKIFIKNNFSSKYLKFIIFNGKLRNKNGHYYNHLLPNSTELKLCDKKKISMVCKGILLLLCTH